MAKASIADLLAVPSEQHDLAWLSNALQWAVELEFATLPVYLSGMWSIIEQEGEVYDLIDSVVYEEMLHLGFACNMLKAIGGTPQIVAPTYPSMGLPGGVRPDLEVYLAGLSPTTAAMYMQIELPEDPLAELAEAQTFPTIGAFYDAIAAAFTALDPPLSTAGQLTASFFVPSPGGPAISENLTVLATPADVQAAIATIKDQGEGTSLSPDAPQFGGELAHYYRFGEIFHGKRFVEVDGTWEFAGAEVVFPPCYDVLRVPPGGYPGVASVAAFDEVFATLVTSLESAWGSGGNTALGNAINAMLELQPLAAKIVSQPLAPSTGLTGNYGPDFIPKAVPPPPPPPPPPPTAVGFKADILPLFTSMDVDHMQAFGVSLDDYAYMSTPANAAKVLSEVSSGAMPPSDSGESAWTATQVALLQSWIDGGYEP